MQTIQIKLNGFQTLLGWEAPASKKAWWQTVPVDFWKAFLARFLKGFPTAWGGSIPFRP
jgi:hypothetical protein